MNTKVGKRSPHIGRRVSLIGADSFSKTSVHDQAALLLSIADIAKSELKKDVTLLWTKDEEIPIIPAAPSLDPTRSSYKISKDLPAPSRRSAMADVISTHHVRRGMLSSRLRSVSIDTPEATARQASRTPSPLPEEPKTVTPTPRMGLRVSTRKRKQVHQPPAYEEDDEISLPLVSSVSHKSSGPLQDAVPKGISIKKISRRKFSWKNYPELEQFLIANREEYLRHSAMNYTVQQKQYNNRLTEKLLELATEQGYIFDEGEFSFVTVRDRIRCYYKSYVQSAKKRGILMGYAARKAGLLSAKDLNATGEIVES